MKTLIAEFTDYKMRANWCDGKFGEYYDFEAKQFDVGSIFGIDEGRVSKIHISHKGVCVVNYDRGWDIEPTKKHKAAYDAILKLLEEAPKRWS